MSTIMGHHVQLWRRAENALYGCHDWSWNITV